MCTCSHRLPWRYALPFLWIPLLVAPVASAASLQATAGGTVTLQGSAPPGSTVYLSVTGPNLPREGARLDDPASPVIDGDPSSFFTAVAGMDGRWAYRWETGAAGPLSPATYQVWLSTEPRDLLHREGDAGASVSVVLASPGITIDTPEMTPSRQTPTDTTGPETPSRTRTPPTATPSPSAALSLSGAGMAVVCAAVRGSLRRR
ncbi:MAG: hypothetical protein ACP5C4_00210 [Methanomicrobiales archaeon]